MILAGLAIAAAAAMGAAPHDGSPAAPLQIGMEGKFFRPGRITALVGETVTWTNDDSAAHDVAATDPALDSGRMEPGARFSHAFEQQGTVRYRCTLHPYMRGTIDVFALALRAPAEPVRAGRAAVLSGRAPAGSGPVTLEGRAPDGAWQAVAIATPRGDQSFAARVTPGRSTDYRARAGALSSAPARVVVASRLTLTAHRRNRSAIDLVVRAEPAQPRARVTIERYVRERFDWRPFADLRLDGRSRGRGTIHTEHRARLRAVLRGVGGYGPARSPMTVVRAAAARVSGAP